MTKNNLKIVKTEDKKQKELKEKVSLLKLQSAKLIKILVKAL